MAPLSVILNEFNSIWGTEFTDADKVGELLAKIPGWVKDNDDYRNAIHNSDSQNAKVLHDDVLDEVVTRILQCSTELYKVFHENESFRKWLEDTSFTETFEKPS